MSIPQVPSVICADTPLTQDWVTIAIVLNKSPIKKTKNSKNFIAFTLGDLNGTEVKFLLFSSAYEEWWKTSVGTLIGVLNAECLPALTENAAPSYKIDNSGKILKIGHAYYFGTCIGISNNRKCENYTNL